MMQISVTSSQSSDYLIDTPDGSLFIPSPHAFGREDSTDVDDMVTPNSDMHKGIPMHGLQLPVEIHSMRLKDLPISSDTTYSGILLKGYRVHQGRFGSMEDSSLLEVVVQSGFDENKCIRIVADGSESVHSFAAALGEEFLNSSDAVELKQVSVLPSSSSGYVCVVEAVYPSYPRFRHLAQTYVGVASSDRSVMEASLSATCNAFGKIMLTFQPEGYAVPSKPIAVVPQASAAAAPKAKKSGLFGFICGGRRGN